MSKHFVRLCAVVAMAAVLGLGLPACRSTTVIKTQAKPAPRVEKKTKAPGPTYVWVPGHWVGRPGHWRWQPGHWRRR